MANRRRAILVRPEYTRPSYSLGNSTQKQLTAASHVHAHAAEGTTTTNVVSVVPVAVRKRVVHTHAYASPATVDTLLEQMKALTSADRKQLLDRAAAAQLLLDSKPADRDVSMWSAAVYDRFCDAVGGPGAAGVGPLVCRRLLGVASAWQPVEQFMSVAGLQELPVVDRQAVYNMLADLLVNHARAIARYTGAPFSVKLVANTVVNIAGVFDSAFPGYLEAGLARMVARRHAQLGTA